MGGPLEQYVGSARSFPELGKSEMDRFHGMLLFVEVARARSFTTAASRLRMPTSTLSRQIRELESSLGVKLLNRTTRAVSLTEVGEVYLSRAASLVDAAEEAHALVRGFAERPTGVLRVSMEAEIGPLVVAPVVAEYCAANPEVKVELDLSPRRVDLLSENYDVAVRLGDLPDSLLTVRRLASLRVGLYCAPDYRERNGMPSHPDDLHGHRRIHLLHHFDGGAWSLSRGEAHVAIPSDGRLVANNMQMIMRLAKAGAGITIADELLAAREVETGTLVPVLPDWTLQPVALSALTSGRVLPAKTRIFIDMMSSRLSAALEGLVNVA